MSHTDPQPTLTPKAAPQEEESLEGLPFGEATRRKPHSGEVDTPLSVFGCKRAHIDRILALVPEHGSYVEPFAGSGAVFFAKPLPKANCVLNDTNGEIFNLFRVLRDQGEALRQRWNGTPYAQDVYRYAIFIHENPQLFDDLTRAWGTMVSMHFTGSPMMYGATMPQRARVSRDGTTTRPVIRTIRARYLITPAVIEKMRRVTLECMDAFECLDRHQYDDGFYFVDPPYAVKGVKVHMGHYGRKFEPEDLLRLAGRLASLRGKFLMTCYDTPGFLPICRANRWQVWRVVRNARHAKAQGTPMVELFVANYDISALAEHGGEPVPLD